jgi:hypothetical protein
MALPVIRACQCAGCQGTAPFAERTHHHQMNVLLSRLDEGQRRWYVAVEAGRLGSGADRLLYEITGIDEKTIRRGRAEVAAALVDQPVERVRSPGAGRWPTEKKIH